MAAACLLSGFGRETFESEAQEIRAYAGALVVAEYLHRVPEEIAALRKMIAELPPAIAKCLR